MFGFDSRPLRKEEKKKRLPICVNVDIFFHFSCNYETSSPYHVMRMRVVGVKKKKRVMMKKESNRADFNRVRVTPKYGAD